MRRSDIKLNDQRVKAALVEMGVTDEKMSALRESTSQAEGDKKLGELKATCKKGYRAVALELHPDKNEGDPKQVEKAEKFKWFKGVYEGFLQTTFRYRPAVPTPAFRVFQSAPGGFGFGSTTSTTTTDSIFTGWAGVTRPDRNRNRSDLIDAIRRAQERNREAGEARVREER